MSKQFALTLEEGSEVTLNGLSEDGAYAWIPSEAIVILGDSLSLDGGKPVRQKKVEDEAWLDVAMSFTDAETKPASDGSITGPVKARKAEITGVKDGEPIKAELTGNVSMELTETLFLETGGAEKADITPSKDSSENAFNAAINGDNSVTLSRALDSIELLTYDSASDSWKSQKAKRVVIQNPESGNYAEAIRSRESQREEGGASGKSESESGVLIENRRVMVRGKNLDAKTENGAVTVSGEEIALDFVEIGAASSTEIILSPFEAAPTSAFPLFPAVCVAAALIAGAAALLIARTLKRKREDKERSEPPVTPYEHTSATNPPPQHTEQLQNISITTAILHEIGKRPSQQDSVEALLLQDGVLAALADGMGGLSDGDKVSQLIMRTIRNDAVNRSASHLSDNLLSLITHANTEVNQLIGIGVSPEKYKSGSTLLLAVMEYGRFRYAAVGDSRIYLFRAGGLIQLNREHIYETELLQHAVNREMTFADALSHPKRKSVTSFLGMGNLRHVDFCPHPVALLPGDKLLLCSDGVFNALPEKRIARILASDSDPEAVASELKRSVLEQNIPQQDNFSAVLAFYG